MATSPEARARQTIDALLGAAGWAVQDIEAANIHASRGVALREFPIEFDNLLEMDFDAVHFRKYQLIPGDILVSEGQSPRLAWAECDLQGLRGASLLPENSPSVSG